MSSLRVIISATFIVLQSMLALSAYGQDEDGIFYNYFKCDVIRDCLDDKIRQNFKHRGALLDFLDNQEDGGSCFIKLRSINSPKYNPSGVRDFRSMRIDEMKSGTFGKTSSTTAEEEYKVISNIAHVVYLCVYPESYGSTSSFFSNR